MLANGVQGIFLAAAIILGVSIMADAAPPVGQPLDPDMSRWYQSLKQPGYLAPDVALPPIVDPTTLVSSLITMKSC